MRIHHLNCGTMCPIGGRLVSGEGSLWSPAKLVCHCLLVETADGLVLVDSGLGLDDVARPRERLGGAFMAATRWRPDADETAARQIVRLGFSIDDVRHVVPTHLDLDHAGGLPDFPKAKVHIFAAEHDAAMARATFQERARYRPAHWAHGPAFVRYEPRGEPWHGFPCVRDLEGLPPEILIVPLVGHTRGHSAIAVRGDQGWLLHAGDAYFHRAEMDPTPSCPPALATFQRLVAVDDEQRRQNQGRLRDLVARRSSEVTVFCAHDERELERCPRA